MGLSDMESQGAGSPRPVLCPRSGPGTGAAGTPLLGSGLEPAGRTASVRTADSPETAAAALLLPPGVKAHDHAPAAQVRETPAQVGVQTLRRGGQSETQLMEEQNL